MIIKKYDEMIVSDVCGSLKLDSKDGGVEMWIREEENSEIFVGISSFVGIFIEESKERFKRTVEIYEEFKKSRRK